MKDNAYYEDVNIKASDRSLRRYDTEAPKVLYGFFYRSSYADKSSRTKIAYAEPFAATFLST